MFVSISQAANFENKEERDGRHNTWKKRLSLKYLQQQQRECFIMGLMGCTFSEFVFTAFS